MTPQDTLASEGEALLRRLGVWDVLQHLSQIKLAVNTGHQLLLRGAQAQVLGINIGDAHQSDAEQEFALARRHAAAARQILQQLTASADWKSLAASIDGLRGTQQFNASLQEGRQRWSNQLLGSKLSAPDISEAMGTWDNVSATLQAGNYQSLFTYLDERFKDFDAVLQPGEDWGRKPHSPLEWWQWLIIAAIVGVAIATILACLFWSGCAWIYAVFVGICNTSVCVTFIF